jgi:predicted RNA-binding Zn-ribbon protein involved in translation (DUF1610 family)
MAEAEFRFPCDACGADLRFEPGADQMVCDNCGATKELPAGRAERQIAVTELDFKAALRNEADTDEVEETRFTKCENCGAEIEFDEQVQATECPFCASPVVVGTGQSRRIKPAALLPFAKSEREARKAMTDWLGKLWFAPNGLQEYARKGRAMQGIYVPYWTYDADTKSRYKGQRGDAYYETRSVRVEVNGKMQTRQEQVRKIRWRRVSGRVARFFDDLLVLASKSLPKKYTDSLAPWELSDLLPYRPEYLAGFRAEGYTISLEDGYGEARTIMDRRIARDVRFDIGGDEQRIDTVDTSVSDVTFKHILLPVWLAAYKYRGKTYRFVVNGQSGTVQGERPYSSVKIAVAVVLGLIVAGVVGYFVAQNG